MQLPHPLWFNHNIRTRNCLRNWEIRAIDLPPLSCAAGRGFGCVAKCAVHIACVAGEFAAAARDCAVGSGVCGVVLDVWIRRRQGGECGFGQAEGFGEDGLWGAGEPVCEVECGSLSKFVSTLYDFGFGEGKVPSSVKICVVKCEKILVLVINTLNGMRLTLGKIPDVSEA
jgi:hypothetical protein